MSIKRITDGLTGKLADLLEQQGLQEVQTRVATVQYRAGTLECERFFEDIKLVFRVIVPFLQKWTKVPSDYEEIHQQMLREMQQPDFVATLDLLTVWGYPKDRIESSGSHQES